MSVNENDRNQETQLWQTVYLKFASINLKLLGETKRKLYMRTDEIQIAAGYLLKRNTSCSKPSTSVMMTPLY